MTNKKSSLLLGAHMSIEGGMEKALERGESIGCTVIQLFTKSNRQWRSKSISKDQAHLFKQTQKKLGIKEVVAHASYLINLASTNKEVVEKSRIALIDELERCELLGIPTLVLHPGSAGINSADAAIKQVADHLNQAIKYAQSSTTIALENMAGQGSALCSTFEQLAQIKGLATQKNRIGFCFDTCHAFVAGYNLADKKEYDNVWHEFEKHIPLSDLKVIHVNDSKKGLGSHVDRHEDIGKGTIGLTFFELLMNDEQFVTIPKILETPKDSPEEDARNMAILIGLIK